MSRKQILLSLLLLLVTPCFLFSQGKSAFSGEINKFREELTGFMGPNLNPEQLLNMNSFLVRWDSAAFSKENMVSIIDLSSQLSGRLMRPVPHFNDFLLTLNTFIENNADKTNFTNWLTGLSEIVFNPRFTNDNIARYLRNTSLMIRDNSLFESGSVRWKVKNSNLSFLHDTTFYVAVSDATLTCYSQNDSTEIFNATGKYFPDIQQFRGTSGIVTWEKAGYSRERCIC